MPYSTPPFFQRRQNRQNEDKYFAPMSGRQNHGNPWRRRLIKRWMDLDFIWILHRGIDRFLGKPMDPRKICIAGTYLEERGGGTYMDTIYPESKPWNALNNKKRDKLWRRRLIKRSIDLDFIWIHHVGNWQFLGKPSDSMVAKRKIGFRDWFGGGTDRKKIIVYSIHISKHM